MFSILINLIILYLEITDNYKYFSFINLAVNMGNNSTKNNKRHTKEELEPLLKNTYNDVLHRL